MAKGRIELGDLIGLRKIRIEVRARADRMGINLAAQPSPAATRSATAFLLEIMKIPGWPQHKGQICVCGSRRRSSSAPNSLDSSQLTWLPSGRERVLKSILQVRQIFFYRFCNVPPPRLEQGQAILVSKISPVMLACFLRAFHQKPDH